MIFFVELWLIEILSQIYKVAGLKNSEHKEVEGELYDKLCERKQCRTRDEVRMMAKKIAKEVSCWFLLHSYVFISNFCIS